MKLDPLFDTQPVYFPSVFLARCNQPPQLISDRTALILNESIPVGTIVDTLVGVDPEGSPVRFSIQGTDKLTVDPESGELRLAKPLDYEVS